MFRPPPVFLPTLDAGEEQGARVRARLRGRCKLSIVASSLRDDAAPEDSNACSEALRFDVVMSGL